LLGQLEHGFYNDNHAGVSPELLQVYYEADGQASEPTSQLSGAGASEEEFQFSPTPSVAALNAISNDIVDSELSAKEQCIVTFVCNQLQSEQTIHVQHPAIKVPLSRCPFPAGNSIVPLDFLIQCLIFQLAIKQKPSAAG
jgi:hypothetical protein